MVDVTIGGPGFVAVGRQEVCTDLPEPDESNSVQLDDARGIDPVTVCSDRHAVVWTSVDGLSWSRVPHDEAIFGGADFYRMNSVIAGGPGLVAVGRAEDFGGGDALIEGETAVEIDAVLDEPLWAEALLMTLDYEVEPGENIPPPVKTEVLIMYDASKIYFAFRCFDPDPSQIRARFSDRDQIWNDDWIGIFLDTFNSGRRDYGYMCNPFGIQSDMIESEEGSDHAWDAIWDSAGRITDEGYLVEIAIPFNSLSFQRSEIDQIWGVDLVRSYPRSVRHHIGVFPRDRANSHALLHRVRRVPHPAVFQGPALAGHVLEVEVSPVDLRAHEV